MVEFWGNLEGREMVSLPNLEIEWQDRARNILTFGRRVEESGEMRVGLRLGWRFYCQIFERGG